MVFDHRADTIVALSSGAGRAAISVVRLSGALVPELLQRMNVALKPRSAQLVGLQNPKTDEILDKCLALYFSAPHSYTGEATAEFHLHGSPAVTAAVIQALSDVEGVRLAEPGEFTRRALENGKLSLLEAEAVGELIDADVSSQSKQALNQLFGHSKKRAEDWRAQLIEAMAYVEANLDFVDESDVEDGVPDTVWESIQQLHTEISQALALSKASERIIEGIRVALIGAPNVGKSSLLNTLARREAAIVSPIAGTTRDIVEVQLDIEGYAFILSDTAGLRATEDFVEKEGVKRARAAAEKADIVLLVKDAALPDHDLSLHELPEHDQHIEIINKIDLSEVSVAEPAVGVSAKTGQGIEMLIERLVQFAHQQKVNPESFVVTRARHKKELSDCLAQLDIALSDYVLEVRAEALRAAARALGRLIGVIDHEQVLDQLFAGFCIGK